MKTFRRVSIWIIVSLVLQSAILLYLDKVYFVTETDFSFPSGHVTTAMVFFGVLAYLILKKYKDTNLILLIPLVFVLLIGFTRLYLGIHWFSDVLGGIFLGEFILTGSLIIRPILENGRSKSGVQGKIH